MSLLTSWSELVDLICCLLVNEFGKIHLIVLNDTLNMKLHTIKRKIERLLFCLITCNKEENKKIIFLSHNMLIDVYVVSIDDCF